MKRILLFSGSCRKTEYISDRFKLVNETLFQINKTYPGCKIIDHTIKEKSLFLWEKLKFYKAWIVTYTILVDA